MHAALGMPRPIMGRDQADDAGEAAGIHDNGQATAADVGGDEGGSLAGNRVAPQDANTPPRYPALAALYNKAKVPRVDDVWTLLATNIAQWEVSCRGRGEHGVCALIRYRSVAINSHQG